MWLFILSRVGFYFLTISVSISMLWILFFSCCHAHEKTLSDIKQSSSVLKLLSTVKLFPSTSFLFISFSFSFSFLQGVLFTFINTNNSNSDVSKTKSSSSAALFHEENKEFEDDEIQKRPTTNNNNHKLGWSGWSDFSTCSRTCDGGVAFQLRRCHSPSGCRGESVRYRICNMQACPDQQDFRAQQCMAFNEVPYDGALFIWTPHYDYSEPCALTCR